MAREGIHCGRRREIPPEASHSLADQPVLPLASSRILIVDDQPSIRGILEVALTEAGAAVWTAADGHEALRSVEQGPPDIILLDLIMPGMNGWGVIEALVQRGKGGIPVILQTTAGDFGSFDRAKKQGVAAFISKPFRLNEVIETCRRILKGARPLQGTAPKPEDDGTPVQIRDRQGNLIAVGRVLDPGTSGAQIDLNAPLSLAQPITLTYTDERGVVTQGAEVRWVTKVGERYHHGVLIRQDQT